MIGSNGIWKQIHTLIKRVAGRRLTAAKALEDLAGQKVAPEMVAHFQRSVGQIEGKS